MRQIGAKGFRALDLGLNDSSNKKLVYQKRQLLAHGLSVILIVISLLHWFVTCKQIDVTRGKLDAVFDASTTVQILTVLSYMSAIKIMVANSMYHILSLPMVSMLTSSTQSAIDHLYTYSGGDLWSFINADLVQNIHGHSATEHADNVSSVLLNVCGCFIATILLYLRGLEAQPILTILLWSGNIVVPTMTQGVLDPAQLLIFDVARVSHGSFSISPPPSLSLSPLSRSNQCSYSAFLTPQFTLAWFATTLSLASVFTLPSAKQLAVDKNSSYHQIDEDSSSDISDASDLVSELNLSNLSSVSKRSAWNHSGPLNSTIALSKAPSVASGLSSMHRAPKSMQSLNALGSMHSVNGLGSMHSVSGLVTRGRRSPSFETANSFRYDSNATIVREQLNRSAFSPAAPSHRDSFGQRNCITPLSNTFTHAADYRGQMSRPGSRNSMYDIPNDFEGGITQLSINGDATNRRRAQPHGLGSTDRLREPLQQRRPVVFPSRLSVDAPAAGNQSWVAGGFWSNTSPQKKSAFDVNRSLLADRFTADVPAMMSRTSSRSSGFESLANSMVNNSREHSLCDENEMDKTYAYADRLADTTVWSQPQRLADYSAANGIGALSLSNGHHHNARSSAGSVYDSSAASAFAASFGPRHRSVTPRTHSFQDVSQASAANAGKTHANRQLARNIENFISFKHDMPMHSYQRGSLIKLNNDGDGKQN